MVYYEDTTERVPAVGAYRALRHRFPDVAQESWAGIHSHVHREPSPVTAVAV